MQEIGIETKYLEAILDGKKTIEGRLGKPKFIKLRVGDQLSLREDIWEDGKIIRSVPGQATIKITQILYFETLEEMLGSIDFTAAMPDAANRQEALAKYRKFYSPEEEYEHGIMAISFKLV